MPSSKPPDRIRKLQSKLQQLDEDMARLEAEFGASDAGARNLLHYVALRRHDLRDLQRELAALGLSSLGRTESHVRTSVAVILRILTHLTECGAFSPEAATTGPTFEEGRHLLEKHTDELLGPAPEGRRVRIMVTMPSEAATDAALVRRLLEAGMNCMRINCAHDGPEEWAAMIRHLRDAETATGRRCRVQMDVAGPKLRTGPIAPGPAVVRLRPKRDPLGRLVEPANVWLTPLRAPERAPGACQATLPMPVRWLDRIQPGSRIRFVDSRGANRELRVRERVGRSCWAEASATTYLTPGILFTTPLPGGLPPATARVGPLPPSAQALRLNEGDTLVLTRDDKPGLPAQLDRHGRPVRPAQLGVTLPEFFQCVKPGEPIWFDDGKIGGEITSVQPDQVTVRIVQAHPSGEKLAAEKGINIPRTDLRIPVLNEDDLAALAFLAAHADIVGFSFVRSAADVRQMREQLAALGRPDMPLMLKIETEGAFENLPPILLEAMRGGPVGVMIARGDLAVECGFERLAEIQEEILWIAEAAYVPVVWATQVLESLAKTGRPSRSEITDAAMGERAECVMLNKGAFVVEAVRVLDNILRRMQGHQEKKTSRLRRLRVATAFVPKSRPGH